MNFKNSETSDLQQILPDLTENINLTESDKYVVLSDLSI